MQRLHLFLLVLTGALPSLSSVALAKPPPYVKQDSEDQNTKPKGKKARAQTELPAPNQDWQWGAGARLGSMVAPLSGLGVEGYKILSPRDRLGLLIAAGRADFRDVLEDEEGILIDQAEVSSSVIMVHGRRFFGETFSMAYGLGQRNITLELAASAIGTDDSIATTLHVSSLAAYAAIGNIWQWDSGFYLGCDWFGVMAPLTSSSKVTSSATGSVSGDLDDVNEAALDAGKDIGKATTFTVLYLAIGANF